MNSCDDEQTPEGSEEELVIPCQVLFLNVTLPPPLFELTGGLPTQPSNQQQG